MLFLGQASNYRGKDIFRHTFSFGTKKDFTALKDHLATRYKVPSSHVALYGTGRSALAAALKSVVKKKSSHDHPEVVITALTCYAVVEAVRSAGFVPVFADVDQKTLHFGAKELEATLKAHPSVAAIIVQNNLGIPCDFSAIEAIVKKYNLPIIEDLAHSTGVFYADGREAGTVGEATILSFGKGKSIDTISGGALILKSVSADQPKHRPKLRNSLRARWYPFFGVLIRLFYHIKLGRLFTSFLLKIHFIERSADAPLSLKTRCTFWQAKLALRQLESLKTPRPPLRKFYLVKNRDAALDKLEKNGFIFNDTWYDCPVAPERYYKKSEFKEEDCPVAAKIANQIINFPTHYSKGQLAVAKKLIKKDIISQEAKKTPNKKWQKILNAHPEANFLQSPEWAEVNQKIGHEVFVEFFDEQSLALMIIKNAKRGHYLEIPGGPLLDWKDQKKVESAFAKIKEVAKQNHCAFIRFRPQLLNTAENRALLPSDAKPASFHLHAEHTIIIDLKNNSEDNLLKNMRRQTRYEVRQSLKKEIVVEKETNKELFKLFHKIQSETAARQNFIPPKLEDLLAYREAFGPNAVIYSARLNDDIIALGLIIKHGVEADYFEAASTPLNRKLPGAYALQWQVMRDLKAQGFERYNLWGIAPKDQPNHRYAKVTTFKAGFGGEVTEFIPAHDIIISQPKYLKTYLIETLRKKRRHLS